MAIVKVGYASEWSLKSHYKMVVIMLRRLAYHAAGRNTPVLNTVTRPAVTRCYWLEPSIQSLASLMNMPCPLVCWCIAIHLPCMQFEPLDSADFFRCKYYT